MKKEIVFITSTKNPRLCKRITNFMKHGYKTHLYIFERATERSVSIEFDSVVVGSVLDGNYIQRYRYVRNIFRKDILASFQGKDVFYYLFGFDIASPIESLLKPNTFIFELGDLHELYIKNKLIRSILVKWNKRIIRRSFETVLTSEGFKEYYFGKNQINNISIIPNKLNEKIRELPFPPQKEIDMKKLHIIFTGIIRFKSIFRFAQVVDKYFDNITLHFYGANIGDMKDEFEKIFAKKKNVFLYGRFKNPDDLPQIYTNADMVLALYDADQGNVKYAEPNKFYEALYYEKPLIVSKGVFLGDKVEHLNVGFVIDGSTEKSIMNFLSNLSKEQIENKRNSCNRISKNNSIDNQELFFDKIAKKLIG